MLLPFQVVQTELKIHDIFSREMTQKFPKIGAKE
jgi:hypothetical protein